MAKSTAKRSTKKLRVAFIGVGMIANAHIRALNKMDDVEIVGAADIDKNALKGKQDEFGYGDDMLFTDSSKMLKAVKPDAVNVCTPNGVHVKNTIDALRAGAHVIVEKPMAMNSRECKRMIEAAKKARKKLVIGFQYRYEPRTQFLKQAADRGTFGDIMFGRVQAMRRRGIPNWGVFGQKHLQGGGPMIDIGVHVLEMTHYVMGSPKPIAATGMVNTYLGNKKEKTKVVSQWPGWDYKTYTVEDIAVGHIRFDNGAVIHIEAMFAGHIEKDVWDFQLMGTQGGCTWSDPKIFTDELGHMVNIEPAYVGGGWHGGHGDAFGNFFRVKNRNFVDHVLHNKPTMAPAEHGLMVQQMLDAIYESSAKGGKEVLIK